MIWIINYNYMTVGLYANFINVGEVTEKKRRSLNMIFRPACIYVYI